MSTPSRGMGVSSPARVFTRLEVDDALLPAEASALRKSGALFLALMVLLVVPLFLAANAAGLIGDTPSALASKGSGHAGGHGHDDHGNGNGGAGDDDDEDSASAVQSNDTSANGQQTRGTTKGNTAQQASHDTSANGRHTGGTTNANGNGTQTQASNDTSANGQQTVGTTSANGNGGDTDTAL